MSLTWAAVATRFTARWWSSLRGERLDHGHGFWQDAIVFVTAGGLNVDCADGQCHRFAEGDILTLARLPIRSVYNGGTARLRLLVIRRTTPASTEGP